MEPFFIFSFQKQMPQSANNVGTINASRHFATRPNYGAYKIELSHYQYLITLTLVETADSFMKKAFDGLSAVSIFIFTIYHVKRSYKI
jgi:hypothetical protein